MGDTVGNDCAGHCGALVQGSGQIEPAGALGADHGVLGVVDAVCDVGFCDQEAGASARNSVACVAQGAEAIGVKGLAVGHCVAAGDLDAVAVVQLVARRAPQTGVALADQGAVGLVGENAGTAVQVVLSQWVAYLTNLVRLAYVGLVQPHALGVQVGGGQGRHPK